jgi:hypothetical protein
VPGGVELAPARGIAELPAAIDELVVHESSVTLARRPLASLACALP